MTPTSEREDYQRVERRNNESTTREIRLENNCPLRATVVSCRRWVRYSYDTSNRAYRVSLCPSSPPILIPLCVQTTYMTRTCKQKLEIRRFLQAKIYFFFLSFFSIYLSIYLSLSLSLSLSYFISLFSFCSRSYRRELTFRKTVCFSRPDGDTRDTKRREAAGNKVTKKGEKRSRKRKRREQISQMEIKTASIIACFY
ncbi:hypothetical protein K0M31_013268 [Melipona bicolor]|uniref:Transmembrane protein n=1 Tax=Melipona bicolor TaxID=60889 RepID=A0AA40FI00_9HYME|nr:hypothetical protein K0M31_013268 [Melipona bicolor]